MRARVISKRFCAASGRRDSCSSVARGMRSAAVPLYEQARAEFADLGHRRDVAELTHLLRLADAQGAPSRPPVAGGPAA